MKNKIILPVLAALLLTTTAYAQIPAFPDAEGGGMWTTGARGAQNCEVYHVTNLNDSGVGSFRDAVSKGNRFIVFDVGGNINLTSKLYISADNLTILGQTAPGEGISIDGHGVYITGSNIIMRYLRVRPGAGVAGENNDSRDALTVIDGEDIIVDHCSFSWSVDECISFYAVKNATVQWSIISEGLNLSTHSKGAHGYGGIWGGINMTGHHNLFATHKARNPMIGTGATVTTHNNAPDTEGIINFRNNVIYNWGAETGYGGQNGMRANIIGNYYKPGPGTKSSAAKRIFKLHGTTEDSPSLVENGGTTGGGAGRLGWSATLFVDDNYIEGAEEVNADNWKGIIPGDNVGEWEGAWTKCEDISDGIYVDGVLKPNNQYLDTHPVISHSAQSAYSEVLKYAGASVKRDEIDTRVINDVINGTAPTGSKSGLGLVDSPDDVGGFIVLDGGVKETDTDNDGIPDSYEADMGLDAAVFDSLTVADDGYTMLEKYAEGLAVHEGEVKADKTALREVIYRAMNTDKYGYKKDTWNNLMYALDMAKETAAEVYASQSDTDAACEEINNALSLLEIDDKYDLRAAIDEALEIDSAMYTMDSYLRLMNAISEAETVYADAEATQDDVDSAITNIQAAVNGLEIYYGYNLAQLIARVEELNQMSYTTESMTAIALEYDSAKNMLEIEASNEELKQQYERLKAVYDARVNDTESKLTGDFENLVCFGIKSGTYGQYRLALDMASAEIAENVGGNSTKALILRDTVAARTQFSYTFPQKQYGTLYYEGDFYFDEQPKSQNILLRLADSEPSIATYFTLMVKRPGLQLQYFNETVEFPGLIIEEKKWYKVGVLFDTVTKKYSIWINGEAAAEGAFADTSAEVGVSTCTVATPGSASQTMAVDNLRIVDEPMFVNHEFVEDSGAVRFDGDIINYEGEDLKLILASYIDGRLVDVTVEEVTKREVSASVAAGDEVKAFVWTGEMEPKLEVVH